MVEHIEALKAAYLAARDALYNRALGCGVARGEMMRGESDMKTTVETDLGRCYRLIGEAKKSDMDAIETGWAVWYRLDGGTWTLSRPYDTQAEAEKRAEELRAINPTKEFRACKGRPAESAEG